MNVDFGHVNGYKIIKLRSRSTCYSRFSDSSCPRAYEPSSGHHWSALLSGEGETKFDNSPGSLERNWTSTASSLLPVSLCALRIHLATNQSSNNPRPVNSEAPPLRLPASEPEGGLQHTTGSPLCHTARSGLRAAVVLGFGYPTHGDPEINAFCGGLLLRLSVSIQVDNPCQR